MTPPTSALIAGVRPSHSTIELGRLDLAGLARRHDTPFFVYDLGLVSRRIAFLRGALPAGFEIAYAVKANPHPAFLAVMAGAGIGADVASGGELVRALEAGFDPARITFTGPGKRDDELAAAVAARIALITVESPGELRRLAAIAEAAGRPAAILLRRSIDPAARSAAGSAESTRLIGDEGVGKFGMDDDDVRASVAFALDSPWLELRGIHAFGASNVRDVAAILGHARRTMAFGRSLAAEFGFALEIVDVGGGLGIPYAYDEPPLDLVALRTGLETLSPAWAADPVTRSTRVLVEPGRFLAGPAGAYVVRVVDTKRVRGRPIAIVDGGLNHLLRPALVGQPQRIRRVAARGDTEEPVAVVGPLCTGLDILARDLPIGLPEVGELLAVLDAGAYGYTESMPFFLSRPLAAEVIVGE